MSTSFELEVERAVLPNGLTILVSSNKSVPSVSINAVVCTGARFESEDQAGLASITGEMIDEGTINRDSQAIAGAIEAVGGRLGTFGDYQISGAAMLLLSENLDLGLEITSDLLMNSTFPEDKLHQQIERRAAQIRSRLDVPRIQASDVFNELVFRGTPQQHPAIGYEETITKITRSDVQNFYRNEYAPDNTLFAVVGDFEPMSVIDDVFSLFRDW